MLVLPSKWVEEKEEARGKGNLILTFYRLFQKGQKETKSFAPFLFSFVHIRYKSYYCI